MTDESVRFAADILMVVYSDYPGDVRVRREAEALTEAGYRVDVICLSKGDQPPQEVVRGVTAYRVNFEHERGGKLRYLWNYARFFMAVMFRSNRLYRRHHYQIIHTHNMPEFLVFAQFIPKLRGARLIVDMHDPMPEVFMSKFGKPADHRLIRLLRRLERASLTFVDAVITTNIAFLELFADRSCPREKITLVMNSPQESVFGAVKDRARRPPDGRFIIMYHGTITRRYGLDTLIEAMPLIRREIPAAELHVYNDGEFRPQAEELTDRLNLRDCVTFFGRLPLEEIAARIPAIDVGVVPNHRDAFTEINLPTRIFEYLCLDRPAVAPRTRGILDYFDETSLHLFEPDDPADLARAIIDVKRDPEKSRRVLEAGLAVYRRYTWADQKQNLLNLVESLCQSGRQQ